MQSALSQLWAMTLDLFFPPHCVNCRRTGAWFCQRCRRAMAPIAEPVCRGCGQGIAQGTLCASCRSTPLALEGIRSAYYFEGPLREAIHAFKYKGVRMLGQPLGEMLYDGFSRYQLAADIIVPVPLHPSRQGQRGFNQSLLLAEHLAQQTGLRLAAHELRRTRNTPSQVGLHAQQRRANVHDAFVWSGAPLQGQRALVIDDVCTTGSTIEACAAALSTAGAASVWGLTLARERFAPAAKPATP